MKSREMTFKMGCENKTPRILLHRTTHNCEHQNEWEGDTVPVERLFTFKEEWTDCVHFVDRNIHFASVSILQTAFDAVFLVIICVPYLINKLSGCYYRRTINIIQIFLVKWNHHDENSRSVNRKKNARPSIILSSVANQLIAQERRTMNGNLSEFSEFEVRFLCKSVRTSSFRLTLSFIPPLKVLAVHSTFELEGRMGKILQNERSNRIMFMEI